MAYEIRFLEDDQILETSLNGMVKVVDVLAAIQKNLVLAKRHQVHLFLVDCSALVDEKEKIFENYEAGTFLARLFDQIPRRFRDAIVLPRDEIARANLNFFETVTRNRGLNVRVFDTRDEALMWLLGA